MKPGDRIDLGRGRPRQAPVEIPAVPAALNRRTAEAHLLGVSCTTLSYWREHEGLPAHVMPGRGSRRIVLYDHQEVLAWLAGRRERQIEATLDGRRYARRRVVPVEDRR